MKKSCKGACAPAPKAGAKNTPLKKLVDNLAGQHIAMSGLGPAPPKTGKSKGATGSATIAKGKGPQSKRFNGPR